MSDIVQDMQEYTQEIPMLDTWKPNPDQIFTEFKGDYISPLRK